MKRAPLTMPDSITIRLVATYLLGRKNSITIKVGKALSRRRDVPVERHEAWREFIQTGDL